MSASTTIMFNLWLNVFEKVFYCQQIFSSYHCLYTKTEMYSLRHPPVEISRLRNNNTLVLNNKERNKAFT